MKPPRKIIPSRPRARPRAVPLPWRLVFGAVVLYGVLTGLHAGNSPGWTAFADTGEVLAATLAAVACTVRAKGVRAGYRAAAATAQAGPGAPAPAKPRLAWPLLAAGVGTWALGQLTVCIYEIGLGTRVPEPSLADVFFLTSYLLVAAGLLAFVRTPAGHLSHLRGAVEALCIACGFLLCSWSLLIAPVLKGHGPLAFADLVNISYPVLDAVSLGAVFFVALRRRLDPPAGLTLLTLGIILWTVSDSAWWYLIETQPTLPSVTPFETGWVAGFVLVAFAAWRSHRPRVWTGRVRDNRLVLSLPALPGLGGVLIVLTDWLVQGEVASSHVVLGIMATFMLLALALLVIVTYENDALTSELERRVEQRTAELRKTERYYRALVQHSSDLIIVLDADLQVRYASDACESVFGFAQQELIGSGLEVFGEDASRTLTAALERPGGPSGHSAPVAWSLLDSTGRRRRAESTITDLLADSDVGGFVLNTRDDTDRVALEEQLSDQAFHDPLTGLPNRALLGDRATQAFTRAQRSAGDVALMALNLDAFKLVNDGFGHDVGDAMLCEVAERLLASVRPEDTVARLGGDEFVILLDPAPAPEEALALAERLLEVLRHDFLIDGVAHRTTASIGIAIGATPQTNFDQLLSDADVALYCVKRAGRDSVQLFEASMNVNARERFRLQTDLRKALDGEGLKLYYQAECDVETGQLDGFEALIRWEHPEHGMLSPDRFIPLAEETGLIVPLGRWVLREALGQAVRWAAEYSAGGELTISVNVSAVQLRAPSIVGDVEQALSDSGIDPARVVLEVTESSVIDSSGETIATLAALKELGVRLAIDDFGTGYTSIGSLQKMPFDILKVDKSFIDAINDGAHGGELLEAVVNIGRVLSLVTIAEGIEEAEQLETARSLGCDLAQGYLFSRPLPPEQAAALIGGAPSGVALSG